MLRQSNIEFLFSMYAKNIHKLTISIDVTAADCPNAKAHITYYSGKCVDVISVYL